VQDGDSLFTISLWYSNLNITVADLQEANCKGSSTVIFVGEKLYVPRTPPSATIRGYVFADPNRNFVQDDGEERLSRITVTVTDANGYVVGTTITDGNGEFEFSNLPYGTYQVFQHYITLSPNQIFEQNFGVVPAQ
jgi:hypothetical protein